MRDYDNTPELTTPLEYLQKATAQVRAAKKRVFLMSFTLFRNKLTAELLEAVETAARRGVDTHIAADFATFTQAMLSGKKIPLTYRSPSARESSNLRKRFGSAGAKFCWLGQYYGATFMGRTHSKWLIVDDVVFSFGGVNIDAVHNLGNTDYMIRIKSHELANALANEHLAIEKADRSRQMPRNRKIKTAVGTVLFDSGRMGKSTIYNTAVELARQASEILLVSQYCPTGKLAKILAQKPAQIYFNQLENVDSRLNRFMIHLGRRTVYDNNLYLHKNYLHAKFIIFTMPDGSRQALTGSHNFVAASGRLGTREVALLTRDETTISQLEKFFYDNIA